MGGTYVKAVLKVVLLLSLIVIVVLLLLLLLIIAMHESLYNLLLKESVLEIQAIYNALSTMYCMKYLSETLLKILTQ